MFQEIVQYPNFFLDSENHFFCLDTGRIIVGENLEYITAIMNSKLFFYAIKAFYGGGGLGEHAVRMKHTFFGKFHVIRPSEEKLQYFKNLYYEDIDQLDKEINDFLYENYNFTNEEIKYIDDSIKLF